MVGNIDFSSCCRLGIVVAMAVYLSMWEGWVDYYIFLQLRTGLLNGGGTRDDMSPLRFVYIG